MNIHAWRAICHIVGDGTVDDRSSNHALIWTQDTKNQKYMRELLELLSRRPGGKGERVNYPKGLTHIIMTTMPTIDTKTLKTPRFIRFVIDLPPEYRDWKVQFLAAFLIDDGYVNRFVSFAQKDKVLLESIMYLCDQLGYDHSPYPPKLRKNGKVYRFRLYIKGVIDFYNDLNRTASKDPLLGLWHKSSNFESLITSYNIKVGYARFKARKVSKTILEILGDHQFRDTKELRNHPKLKFLLKGLYPGYLLNRLNYLYNKGFINQVKRKQILGRPYVWAIVKYNDSAELIKEFQKCYGIGTKLSERKGYMNISP